MSQPPIEKLTPFQEALIPIYREKWIAYTLSTEPINRKKENMKNCTRIRLVVPGTKMLSALPLNESSRSNTL